MSFYIYRYILDNQFILIAKFYEIYINSKLIPMIVVIFNKNYFNVALI